MQTARTRALSQAMSGNHAGGLWVWSWSRIPFGHGTGGCHPPRVAQRLGWITGTGTGTILMARIYLIAAARYSPGHRPRLIGSNP